MSGIEPMISFPTFRNMVLVSTLSAGAAFAQSQNVAFHKTFPVLASESVVLEADISQADLQISYSRDGQITVTASAKAIDGSPLDPDFFEKSLHLEQIGNRFSLRQDPSSVDRSRKVHVALTIDVPYRTELTSNVAQGRQAITGIMGPVHATSGQGDIQISYIAKGVDARADTGNLDLQVIGEHVAASAGVGNISCTRIAQGANAETADGDITLTVVGSSSALVRKGSGRADVNGAQGSLTVSTDAGELHVKAEPHGNWKINSASGNLRLELPARARFELDASTDSGNLQPERDDLRAPEPGTRHFSQIVNNQTVITHIANNPAPRIEAHTGSGRIVIR